VADRYFEPADVERLIPALTSIMEGVMAAHAEMGEIQKQLRAEQERISLAGGGVPGAAFRAGRERLEALTRRIQAGLQEIAGLGGVPKDLTLGLVDFPHLREGREVNLCWRFGEREIRYWHGRDEGYAGRKPL
jgi:hypothetical protein